MRGKRAKAERNSLTSDKFFADRAYKPRADAIRPGRKLKGPGANGLTYPKSMRFEQMGDFEVLVTDIETIKEAAK